MFSPEEKKNTPSIPLITNTKFSLFLMGRLTTYAPPNSERETTKHSEDGGPGKEAGKAGSSSPPGAVSLCSPITTHP